MPKRSSKKAPDTSDDLVAGTPADSSGGEADSPPPEKNAAAVALGRLGGKKGGPARAAKLTKEQRSEIAKKAAEARWKKRQG